jgi:hypothetical protein
MLKACALDAGASFTTTLANCENAPTGAVRASCREDARSARQEDLVMCREVREAREDTCDLLGENRYAPDPLVDPDNAFIDPNDIPESYAPNPYVSLEAGRTLVLRGGEQSAEIVVVHVTDQTREIEDVPCRVVADVVVEAASEDGEVGYEPIELTDDWLAQDVGGDVFYCGELTRGYEDGVLRTLEGSFEAGRDFAKAGVLIRAAPAVGETHRQEFALGEAEDIVRYVDTAAIPPREEGGENETFPCAPNGCLKTFEFTPLEPGSGEFKYYLAGVGQVLGVALEDDEPTGERDELLCDGDSLDVLADPSCKIERPQALLDALCKLAPDEFCSND